VFAADDDAKARGQRVIDASFVEQHTHGFDAFESKVRQTSWEAIESGSGLSRAEIDQAGQVYVDANRVITVHGMGLTQHVEGFSNVTMLVNMLLLKGNIGRKGTGISPIRGHSNVQGQRTVGISEKPELVPLDKLVQQFGFEPPREKGLNTVEACEGMLAGKVNAFIGLGGNFVRAIPERDAMEQAWTNMRLTVQVATKLNRSHLVNGAIAYLLPCLGRTEEDKQASGFQAVTMEDTFSFIHGSLGRRKPASEHLRSEIAIVAGLAKAALPENPKLKWDKWLSDYSLIRDLIAETYPDEFHDFNKRMFQPGGFYRGNSARDRIWNTPSGKAEFIVPETLTATGFDDVPGRYRLITMRSNDQFNTTIYGFSDRLRGIEGTRQVLLINPEDMARAGLYSGQIVSLVSDAADGKERKAGPLKVTPFKLPDGCVGSYYPEMNSLIPLSHHDRKSKTPAAKSVPVRICI
jgi:molybdopterin-dependent oxidoreductase alpha subunit